MPQTADHWSYVVDTASTRRRVKERTGKVERLEAEAREGVALEACELSRKEPAGIGKCVYLALSHIDPVMRLSAALVSATGTVGRYPKMG